MIPPGGLLVYPRTGGASVISVGATSRQGAAPVLFSLSYYGNHHPESKSIRLAATKEIFPANGHSLQGFVKLGARTVIMASQTQGAFHTLVTTASRDERGDSILVTTEGSANQQVDRFIEGLTERNPPRP